MRSDSAAYVVDLASTAEGGQTVATGLAVWLALRGTLRLFLHSIEVLTL